MNFNILQKKIQYLQQMKRERGEECETKKNNWLDIGFSTISYHDLWIMVFANRHQPFIDENIDGDWFNEYLLSQLLGMAVSVRNSIGEEIENSKRGEKQ